MGIVGILIAVLVFSLLIFVHELGHFLAARSSGVKVNEFAFGMGPRIISREKNGTIFSIRAFPIGGFCAMEGEDEESSSEQSYGKARWSGRFLITIAGSAMNLLLGLLLLGLLTSQLPLLGTTKIAEFMEGASSNTHLQVDDTILKVNGHRVHTMNDINYELSRDRDGLLDMELERNGEKLVINAVPFQMMEEEGVRFVLQDFKVYGVKPTFLSSVKYTFNWAGSTVKQVWGSLADLFTQRYTVKQLSGPVGVATVISEASALGWRSVVNIASLISINLGLFNLLPLPALDGGRLVFLLIELFRRKPVDQKYEGAIHATGFIVLIGFMIFVTFNDVLKFF